ncbi:MAG: hypothetical protein ACM3JP_02950 [Betaproteobacteria bacterium]
MSTPRFLPVLTRTRPAEVSPAALGTATGRLAEWVAALRRWRLLDAVAIQPAPTGWAVSGCLLVAATDLAAARRLAATCPVGAGAAVAVLPVHAERTREW